MNRVENNGYTRLLFFNDAERSLNSIEGRCPTLRMSILKRWTILSSFDIISFLSKYHGRIELAELFFQLFLD